MRVAQVVVGVALVALMLWQGFWAGVAVFLALLLVYGLLLLVSPVYVHARLRIDRKPEVLAVADDGAVPDVVRAELDGHRKALSALGFEARDIVHQPTGIVPGMYLALYRHRPTGASALSRVPLKPGQVVGVNPSELEFELRYDDGTSVELSNVGGVTLGLEQLPGLVRRMSHVRDVPLLWNYFLRLVEMYEKQTGFTELSRVAMGDDVGLKEVYHGQLDKAFDFHERAGRMVEAETAGVMRPTWRTAAFIAAANLSPGAEFFRRRVRVRGQRLQRELEGDATLTRAERIGPRAGWPMLVAGLVLGAIAVLMGAGPAAIAATGMVIVWSLMLRRGTEPGSRDLTLGGLGAAVLMGIPLYGGVFLLPQSLGPETSELLQLAVYLFPMVLLTLAAVLVLEGFRAAAT